MRTRWRAILWRYRIVLAALCLGWAAMIVVGHVRPAPPATTEIAVAAAELPAGTVLTAADIETLALTHPPEGAQQVSDVLGATLAVGVPEGLPVVPSLLVGPGLVAAAPPNTVVMPIRLADPALAQMVRVGDVIDLYLAPVDTGGQILEAQLIAAGALVMSKVDTATSGGSMFGMGGATSSEPSGVVVVAVSADTATLLTGASSLAPFRAVLVANDSS